MSNKFGAKVYLFLTDFVCAMKPLFIPMIFSTLLLTASIVNAAPCTSGNCVTSQKSFNGVRHYGGLGTKNWKKRVFGKTTKGWFRTEWNKVMATVVKDHSCALQEHYPTLVGKVHWSEAYIDSSIKPTRAQARDPKWSNYVWNQPENGNDFVYDGITDAVNDPLIDNGKGIAKLAVIVGLTASSDALIPPVWMRKDKSLTWLEPNNVAGKNDHSHVRFDNPVAVDHAADFLTALLAKYGNNKGIHSISLAEYFLGVLSDRPAGLNKDKYLVGVKNLWSKVVQAAPRDADGNRVNIMQFNPLLNAEVTINDLEALGIGISESDTQLHFGDAITRVTATMKKLYDGKKVHVMIGGDARFACQGRRQGWDGTPNPFGHKNGYSGVATPQELFWFHSDKGPVPTHSFFLTIANYCKGAPQTSANFIDAIKKFGRCGTETNQWGVAPVAFSNGSNNVGSVALKPNPPPAVIVK